MADAKKSDVAPVLERNISMLVERRRAAERKGTRQERVAAWISRFAGSMLFVYIHVVLVGVWVAVNLEWTPLPPFDPTFVVLAMVASVEAIFLSTFVLITQNRMAQEAERRAELALQISLLAEHEITRILTLTTDIAGKLGVAQPDDPEMDALKRDVLPERVLDRIDEAEREQDRK